MRLFIVTIKLTRNPEHDPKHKVTGICPLDSGREMLCTDVTGEHHTQLVYASDESEVPSLYARGTHITRIESVPDIVMLNL